MYTRSSSRRAFSCASRIASRYVIVIEPIELRRFVRSRRDTKFRCLGLPGVHAEHRRRLVPPAVSRFFSSPRAKPYPPIDAPADRFRRPSGNRAPVAFGTKSYPCRKHRRALRGPSAEGSFRPPFVGHVRPVLAPSRRPAPPGSRAGRSRPRSDLRRRNRWLGPLDRYRRIGGGWALSRRTDCLRQRPPGAIFRLPPC